MLRRSAAAHGSIRRNAVLGVTVAGVVATGSKVPAVGPEKPATSKEVKAIKANVEDKKALMSAIRASSPDTVRGKIKFDEFGNATGDVYIRKVTRTDGRLVNSVIKDYPNVSQFWTYDKTEFLKNPVYSRDFPPAKNLEP